MKDLENFYNNHYKTKDMLEWAELTVEQKNMLTKSPDYFNYQTKVALANFGAALEETVKKCQAAILKIAR